MQQQHSQDWDGQRNRERLFIHNYRKVSFYRKEVVRAHLYVVKWLTHSLFTGYTDSCAQSVVSASDGTSMDCSQTFWFWRQKRQIFTIWSQVWNHRVQSDFSPTQFSEFKISLYIFMPRFCLNTGFWLAGTKVCIKTL